MNPVTAGSAPTRVRKHSLGRWVFGVMTVCTVSLALAVYNLVTLTREATALRDEVTASLHVPVKTRIQGTLGPLVLGTVRAGLHFIDHIPVDAREALAAVRTASVGVYRLSGPVDTESRIRMFASADAVMNRRGWIRIVGVNDHEDTVLIYTPAMADWGRTQRICLAVCSDDEIVVAAATANTEALAKLVARHTDLGKL